MPPHPANVSGDFYVEDGCCTLCEVPFSEAANLFGWWPNPDSPEHCFVKRQPQNSAEVDQMVMAIRCAELQCIHYRGSDRELQSRLVNIGEGMICDNLPPDLRSKAERIEVEKLRRYQSESGATISFLGRIRNWLQRYR
jgi:hypothetical protein